MEKLLPLLFQNGKTPVLVVAGFIVLLFLREEMANIQNQLVIMQDRLIALEMKQMRYDYELGLRKPESE